MERSGQRSENYSRIISGIRVSLPVAVGYLPIAVTFGVLARSAGMPPASIIMMSVLVFAGASQFVAVNLLAGGAGVAGVIVTTFFVNLRHILLSATTSEKLKHENKGWLAVMAFGITDESFSLLSTDRRKRLPRTYVLGLITVPYLAWVGGTAAGAILGGQIPSLLESSMEIALYAMFIGLLYPEVSSAVPKLYVALLALFLSSLLHWLPGMELSEGWIITLVTLISALAGAALFNDQVGEEGDEDDGC